MDRPAMPLDPCECRSHFPSLSRQGSRPAPIFLDNPAGTQVAQEAIDAVQDYYLRHNANHGGAFATSVRSEAIVREARAAMADFLGAPSPDEIVFGANMTTLAFHLSRSIGTSLSPGDEIVVTRLDHDANVAPWRALEERGARVRWIDLREEDCTLDPSSMRTSICERTKLVAVGYASNAVGTIHDVREVVRLAHAAGALVFVDAVHYAPHAPIDVASLGCDFLACSPYKFFGPHLGVLYGKLEHLERLPAYKVRPAPDSAPDRFETGTLNHEGIAGTLGVLRYLEELGGRLSGNAGDRPRKERLRGAMTAIREYERTLSRALLEGLFSVEGVKVRGITNLRDLDARVPTVSFTVEGASPRAVAQHLGRQGIQVWDGHHFAPELMERLSLGRSGGTVRVGAVHYNTADEIATFVEALRDLPR